MNYTKLATLTDDPLDIRYKGFAPTITDETVAELTHRAPTLVDAGFSFPMLVIHRRAIEHNIQALETYRRLHGIQIAPHGKTSMSPELHALQLRSGAWGLTAATIHQVAVYRSFGVPRVLLANQLVDEPAIRWLIGELDADSEFDFYCYVDSIESVRILDDAIGAIPTEQQLSVLVEIGYLGGRTGCRSLSATMEVASAVADCERLRLAGISGYEGLIKGGASSETISEVTTFVRSLRDAASAVLDADLCESEPGTFVVSCGGSAYFDIVAQELGRDWDRYDDSTVVLRCGSYVTHDNGLYAEVSPFSRADPAVLPLQPALQLWAHVLSIPEPGLCILGVGRRDLPLDSGMPTPQLVWSRGEQGPRASAAIAVTRANDHHLFLEESTPGSLRVGDLVGFGVSHPCTAFDKWRLIPVVDDEWHIVDCVHTFF